ncbi:anion transporter [Halarchaeum rubridurum]|uniref:Anion transporter n=1 Tax=Halarchaeum rubridurum TaxID=489911 RepID=A0A830G5D5_9EURY|nr:SLC13 family permease [Halarchaeum rubridurum]MBP1955648.1 anion transporter [Halarchaeum rubridurum]GGM76787.1 citrate transporter [Halarchaeum rubridurum]
MSDELTRARPSRTTVRRGAGLCAALAAIAWGSVVPAVLVPPVVQDTVAVFVFALALWLTDALPYVVTSVLTLVLLIQTDVAPTFRAAASGFSSSLVFFLLLVFLLGAAVANAQLDEWVASRIVARGGTTHPFRSFVLHVLALAFVMPSAVARAATFAPVVHELADAHNRDRDGSFSTSAFLVLGHVNPIGSLALMTGGGMALVAAGVVRSAGYPLTWLDWAILMAPPVLILYVVCAVLAARLYGGSPTPIRTTSMPGRDPNRGLTREQCLVTATLVGAVGLWLAGSVVSLPAIVPAALAVAVLASPGVDVLSSADLTDVNWGILFLVGTMFSLLDRLEATSAFDYAVGALTAIVPFHTLSHWEGVVVLLAFAVSVRIVFSTGSAALLVVLPVVLRVGASVGIAPVPLALASVLLVGATTVFPFNTTAVLVAMTRGPIESVDVLRFGLVTAVSAAVVVALSWLFYWPLALGAIR